MPNRSEDWFKQSIRDLEQARDSRASGQGASAGLLLHPDELRRVLCYGSAAKGTWGAGSDLDVLVEVAASGTPFVSRPLSLEPPAVPVPVEILVYATEEIERMRRGIDGNHAIG